ncbi:hypothetical protein PIROE2DRAFT_18815, partial [Piromyces sp. E2]
DNNNIIFLTTSDQGNVNVTVNNNRTPYNSRFVEVIGQVTGDDSITETLPALSLGDDFESYNKLIQYQRKFPDIF